VSNFLHQTRVRSATSGTGRGPACPTWARLGLLAGLVSAAACVVVDDPEHCWNRERDATCELLFPGGSVCSRCARGFNGCVDPDAGVPASCLDDAASSSDSGASESTGDATSSDVTACTGDGPSEACPADAPYCVSGSCEACDAAGGDSFCADLSDETRWCHPAWGQCVECYAPDSCGAGLSCTTAFECGACSAHEECPGSACDLVSGTCMAPDLELWIEADDAICDDAATGKMAAHPLCSLGEAFTRVAFRKRAIFHLAAGSYDGVDLAASCLERHIAVLGSGSATVIHDGDASEPPLAVCDDAVFVQGVSLHANTGAALTCGAGAAVWLDDVTVESGTPGIHAEGCEVTITRSRVRDNVTHAIELLGGSQLAMTSSIVAGTTQSGAPTGAMAISSSIADIRSSTFADNEGFDITCSGASDGNVSDSLMVSRPASVSCPFLAFDHSVVGTSEVDGADNVATAYDARWFVSAASGDFRLSDAAHELASVGQRDLGDPRLDLDGDAWPDVPGVSIYPGADQP
jgi:parallel beta helix pectate lyase-like protein